MFLWSPVFLPVKHGGIVIHVKEVDNHISAGRLSARSCLCGDNLEKKLHDVLKINSEFLLNLKLELSGLLRIELLVVLDAYHKLSRLFDDRR